ncbi:Kinesin-like protein KIF3A [Trichoplax sp. H2]|uniref:Kinesin-like protein n=1 Tax=Trichoplax adhaerens TaxID=10228 RepID=B3RWP1_TRIAD|nr:hypothetical protein TRIADDRAFT_56826 [Trichoplax adhaerens]EDV25164.1 hypothetical protein TRIADDRAFT_56826 [Trichoplax adhaerens]RDD41732.1 Kinesin-like protein KIF3A [Trichoplax sp. H2]|eukprot:XP_002113054.1 hypothetical protein TRIADDRAFT_56826 [Trichoplax adhaerens]
MPSNKEVDNVQVAVRCRPLNEKEKNDRQAHVIKVNEANGTVTLNTEHSRTGDHGSKTFTFDTVFGSDSKQVDVYNQTARKIVESVLEGYNGTIFAYGQTGTGKTFTMEGVRSTPELRGIIPNSFAHIFGHIAKSQGDARFLVRVSYMEIYNEEVRDLLGKDQNARLEVKERPDVGVYVKDLSAFVVNNADDMDKIMNIGNKSRSVGATDMNAQSSRSHAIFSITVECSEKGPDGEQHVRVGKLHLVDLAGSERQTKTGATGVRLKEATKINLSLSTLGNVISALVDGRSTHIPYRNSKLTRLLQDSLGGNAKTVMIATVGPSIYNVEESISTLRYANRAKNIKNHAKINEDPKDAMLRQFQQEIEKLKKQLENEGYEEGSSEGSEYSGEEEIGEDGKPKPRRRRKKKGKRPISPGKREIMMKQIEEEKAALKEKTNMAETERQAVTNQLEERQKAIEDAQKEHEALTEKLRSMEKKVIVGGVNLLEKAEEQEQLLEESAKELADRQQQQKLLEEKIQRAEAEYENLDEKYSNLQEGAAGVVKKLKKLQKSYDSAKAELQDLREEHERELEDMMLNIKQLTRDIQMQSVLIDNFIPIDCQTLIESNMAWSEEMGDWQLRSVAYTGNNMRKRTPSPDKNVPAELEIDLSKVYLSYNSQALQEPVRKAANKSRPKTGKKKNKGH